MGGVQKSPLNLTMVLTKRVVGLKGRRLGLVCHCFLKSFRLISVRSISQSSLLQHFVGNSVSICISIIFFATIFSDKTIFSDNPFINSESIPHIMIPWIFHIPWIYPWTWHCQSWHCQWQGNWHLLTFIAWHVHHIYLLSPISPIESYSLIFKKLVTQLVGKSLFNSHYSHYSELKIIIRIILNISLLRPNVIVL